METVKMNCAIADSDFNYIVANQRMITYTHLTKDMSLNVVKCLYYLGFDMKQIFTKASNGCCDIVDWLLLSNVPLSIDILYYPCKNNDVPLLITLIQHGAQINIPKEYWCVSPLGAATIFGSIDIIYQLYNYGADMSAKDQYGMNAYHYASYYQQFSVVEVLKTLGVPTENTDPNYLRD